MINQGTNIKLNENDILILEKLVDLLDVQKEKLRSEVSLMNSNDKFSLINTFFKLRSQPSTEIINFFSSYSSKLAKLIQSKLLTSREKLIIVFIEEGLRSLIQFDVPETKIVFNVLKAVLARLSPLTEADLQYFETDKQIGSHIKDILNMKKTLKDENDAALEIVTTNKQILSSMIEQSDKENKLINKFISSLKKLSEPHEVDFQKSKSAIDKITKNLMNLLAAHSEKLSQSIDLKTKLKELEKTCMSTTKVTRQNNRITLSWEQYAEYYNFRKYGSANALNHAHDYLYYLRGRQKSESLENWLEHVGVGFETYYCLNPSSDDVLSFSDVKAQNELYKALNAFNDVYHTNLPPFSRTPFSKNHAAISN